MERRDREGRETLLTLRVGRERRDLIKSEEVEVSLVGEKRARGVILTVQFASLIVVVGGERAKRRGKWEEGAEGLSVR